jgi:hypothetical protein
MTKERFLSAMLAARSVVGTANPTLLNWAGERWTAWLHSQRSDPPDVSKPRAFIVAALTCVEDLPLHVGLMQVLASGLFRCNVTLTVATPDLVRLLGAQARRGGWEHLVQIVEQSEVPALLERLAGSARLAVFPLPCMLKNGDVAGLSVAGDLQNMPAQGRNIFIGRARDFSAWNDGQSEAVDGDWIDAVTALRSQSPKTFPSKAPSARSASHSWGDAGSWPGVQSDPSGLDLSAIEESDELVVRSVRDPFPTTVLARRAAVLSAPGQPLTIKASGSLLGSAPQVLRVEAYKIDGRVKGSDFLFRVPPSRLEAWMISAYLNRGGGGNAMIRAFAEGVGCRIAYAEDEPETLSDIPVVWGVLRDSDRILAQAKAQGLNFFYIDHAYFNRGHDKAYRITRNRYEAGPVRDCPTDRLDALNVDVRPWRRGGREIIVCPPTEYFKVAHGCEDWLETTLETLAAVTDRPVTIREKPLPTEVGVPLDVALQSAHALVTHSSNVAIEAACLGTPIFVDPASAAAPIGLTDLSMIETPVYPDRQAWLSHLAYSQFSMYEIRDGSAWRLLREQEERDFV